MSFSLDDSDVWEGILTDVEIRLRELESKAGGLLERFQDAQGIDGSDRTTIPYRSIGDAPVPYRKFRPTRPTSMRKKKRP